MGPSLKRRRLVRFSLRLFLIQHAPHHLGRIAGFVREKRNCSASGKAPCQPENLEEQQGSVQNQREWHRVYAWSNLSKFAKTLQKGQLITLEGILRYREVEEDVKGTPFKHRVAEIHAVSMKAAVEDGSRR